MSPQAGFSAGTPSTRDRVAEAIRLARQQWVGGPDYEFDLALADAALAEVNPEPEPLTKEWFRRPVRPAALDRDALAAVLQDWWDGLRPNEDFSFTDLADRILTARLEAHQ